MVSFVPLQGEVSFMCQMMATVGEMKHASSRPDCSGDVDERRVKSSLQYSGKEDCSVTPNAFKASI